MTRSSETPKRAAISAVGYALVHEVAESLELVGGVHVVAHDVFDKADFARVDIAVRDFAGHAVGGLDIAFLRKLQQRLEALASGDNGEFLAVLLHDKILLQAVRPDAGGKFRDETLVLRLADVARERDELVEGYFDSRVSW